MVLPLLITLLALVSAEATDEAQQHCPGCVGYCLQCADGKYGCFPRPGGYCCGCPDGECWACPLSSQCSRPNCGPESPLNTIIAVVVVFGVLIFVFSIAAWRRYRYGYWGWNSEPAVVVTHYNDTTYGYDHHHHHHHGGVAQTGYQVGGPSVSVTTGYSASTGYQTGYQVGGPSVSGTSGYPAQQGYQVS